MSNYDDMEKRLETVLGSDTEVCSGNLAKWRGHLLKNLTFPLRVTGTEDFLWEEPYVFGGFDADEYEELKKTNPSYKDQFDLLGIGKPRADDDDLVAKVRRVSDQKMFKIDLS